MKRLLVLVLALASIACVGCSQSERVVVSAAEVVNEVARRGDQIDAVAVDACHMAESVAVELPDIDEAEKAVMVIRARCDAAFAAVDALEAAIEQVDIVFAAVERGDLTVRDLVSAAIGARQAFERAQKAHTELREFLKEVL